MRDQTSAASVAAEKKTKNEVRGLVTSTMNAVRRYHTLLPIPF